MTTTDGGAAFRRLPAPGAPFGPSLRSPPAAANIRFANPEDGWAFGPGLYATHDGGQQWAAIPMPGTVTDLEPGLGVVYALVMQVLPCAARNTCTSAATKDMYPNLWTARWPAIGHWTPDTAAGAVSEGLAVHGQSVWAVSGTDVAGVTWTGDSLLHSADDGVRFATQPGVAVGSTECGNSAVSAAVIWAYCSFGHFMGAYRSTDAGAHFTAAAVGETTRPTPDGYPDGSTLAAASADVAVAANIMSGPLIRTTDGGATWVVVQRPPDRTGCWSLIGFTTPQVGYALWQDPAPYAGAGYPATAAELWRTTDGGATWSPVKIRGGAP
jgi:photosystem II stability/assembly factor-like uncharacterized protein